MMYYLKIETLELEIKNYPKKYPVIFLFTDRDIAELRKYVVKTELIGASQVDQKLRFGSRAFDSPYKNYKELLNDVFKPMDENYPFEEISEETYNLIKVIEAWNPIKELLKNLTNFVDSAEALQLDKDELKRALSEIQSKEEYFN